MSFFKDLFGPSAAQKKQALVNQMSSLERYTANNGVEIVQDDPNNPFVKCDIENEHIVRRNMNTQLVVRPNDKALNAQREQLLHKEFFLKVGENKFVSLGNTDFLDFDQAHISNIIGLKVTASKEYQNQLNQFMNNYLYSRTATTTVNPEKDETNTLLKTFLRAAKQITDKREAEEEAKFLSSQHEKRYKQRSGESDWDYERRIDSIERELAHQELTDPKNCRQNFPLYLSTPVDAIIGIGAEHRGKTIYEFLVGSLGSIEGGFEKQFRYQTNMSGYDIGSRQQMARYALQPAVQQGFIDALCKSRVALQILGTADSEDIGGGQSYYQTSQHDTYTLNVWRALRLCLEQLENYILKQYMPQLPDVPNEQSPPPPPPPSAPPLDIIDDVDNDFVVGGKLKSRSKSIRKKRISHRKKRTSHRKKKSHSHKRRTPKRRTVNQ